MRWLVSFADHLCLVDRLVVVLDPADLGFAAGLALVDLKLVDLGRLVPAGSDLDLAIHFVNFAGLVGFALADLPVVLDLIDPVQFDLAQNRHWGFHQCPFLILSPFLTQSGLFRRHSRCEVEAL